VWKRGKGFARAVGHLNRDAQKVVVQFRAAGSQTWKKAARVGIDDRGRWSTRVKVTRAGSWRAVVKRDARNVGAVSTVRTIRLR